MSWDGYVDSVIANSKGNCTKAALIGTNGAVWTPSTCDKILNVDPQEAMSISKAFVGEGEAFKTSGFVVGGTKYMFLRMEEENKMVLGKKKDIGAISMMKTKSAIIIAFLPEGKQQGDVNIAVAGIANYLEGAGY